MNNNINTIKKNKIQTNKSNVLEFNLQDYLENKLTTGLSKKYFSEILSKEPHNKIADLYLDRSSVKLGYKGDNNIESIVEKRFPLSKIPNIQKSIELINSAIKNNKHITIITDQDIDGVSSYIMYKTVFDAIGYNNYSLSTIPSREDSIDKFASGLNFDNKSKTYNTDLVLFTDTGSTLFSILTDLEKKGVKTIVVDHHKLDEENVKKLPKTTIMLNPHLSSFEKDLNNQSYCGAGLAYKLMYETLKNNENKLDTKDFENVYQKLNTLFLIGTLSDIVPLIGENFLRVRAILEDIKGRYIADVMSGKRNEKLSKFWHGVFSTTAISGDNIDSGVISTSLIPMLRTSLYTRSKSNEEFVNDFQSIIDGDNYNELLFKLNSMQKENKNRTLLQKHVANTVYNLIEKGEDELVIDEKTNQGMLGSVASKLSNIHKGIVSIIQGDDFGILNFKIYRNGNNFVLVSNDFGDTEKLKISIRSYNDNVYKMISDKFKKKGLSKFYPDGNKVSDDDTIQFGGHETIVGAIIGKNQLNEVLDVLRELKSEGKKNKIDIIGEFDYIDFVSSHNMLVKDLMKGTPYDMGNEPPAFLIKNMLVEDAVLSYDKKYLKLSFKGAEYKVIALMYDYNLTDIPKAGDKINAIMTITPGYFGNSYVIKEIV